MKSQEKYKREKNQKTKHNKASFTNIKTSNEINKAANIDNNNARVAMQRKQ